MPVVHDFAFLESRYFSRINIIDAPLSSLDGHRFCFTQIIIFIVNSHGGIAGHRTYFTRAIFHFFFAHPIIIVWIIVIVCIAGFTVSSIDAAIDAASLPSSISSKPFSMSRVESSSWRRLIL